MNGKLRLSPRLTTIVALAWLGGWLGIYLVGMEKRLLIQAGVLLLKDAVGSLGLSEAFWKLAGPRLLDIGSVLLLTVSAWCLGLAVLRVLRWAEERDALIHLMGIATGFGLWAWLVLLFGLAGILSPLLYLAVAVASLPLAAWHAPWRRQDRAIGGTTARSRLRGLEIFLLVCLGVGVVLNLIPAFSPEIEYDSLEYHLGALREYQKAGHIFFLEHNFYASMPSLTEMLYLWTITLRASAAAKLLHGMFGLLTAVGLYSFGKRMHGRLLGLTAAALYYLLPFVTSLAETARIDLATTFFTFLAGAMLYRHLFERDGIRSAASGGAAHNGPSALWLGSLAIGLALATKYTVAPVVLIPLILVWAIHRKQSTPLKWPSALRVALLVAIPVLPWLLKNLWFTGNPVYPFANTVFHSPYWNAASDALFHSRHAPSFDSVGAWTSFVTAIWQHSVRDPFSSPILLLFAPLFLLTKPEPRWKYCAWIGCLIYVCWFAFTFRPWRFLFPAFPWFALLGASAIVSLEQERAAGLLTRTALGIMLVFNLNYSFLLSAVDISNPDRIPPAISKLAVFFGRATASEYLASLYYTQGWMSANLPANACVLYVGEARTYFAPYRVLANTVYDRSILGEMVAKSRTPDDLWKQMQERGVTHIYINQDEMRRVRQNYDYLKDMNWPLFQEFLRQHTRILLQNNAHTVYVLTP